MDLEKRFEEEIAKEKFSDFEIEKFTKDPVLAIRYGMAMGYHMCLDDELKKVKELNVKLQKGFTKARRNNENLLHLSGR